MGSLDGKIIAIDKVNTIKNNEIRLKFQKIGFRVLGVTPRGLPHETALWVQSNIYDLPLQDRKSEKMQRKRL